MLPAKRSLLLALAAVALLLLQEAECAGDNGRETRAEGTCRSVGSLKFDPAEQPMQRVRAHLDLVASPLFPHDHCDVVAMNRARDWRSAASTRRTRAARTPTRMRYVCACQGRLLWWAFEWLGSRAICYSCRKIREPVVAKFNPTCQKITEVSAWMRECAVTILWADRRFLQELVCSPCHPFVGTWQMRTVCPQLCDQWCGL